MYCFIILSPLSYKKILLSPTDILSILLKLVSPNPELPITSVNTKFLLPFLFLLTISLTLILYRLLLPESLTNRVSLLFVSTETIFSNLKSSKSPILFVLVIKLKVFTFALNSNVKIVFETDANKVKLSVKSPFIKLRINLSLPSKGFKSDKGSKFCVPLKIFSFEVF